MVTLRTRTWGMDDDLPPYEPVVTIYPREPLLSRLKGYWSLIRYTLL